MKTALANNTAGFVRITQNARESVVLLSYSQDGQLEDAEVFFMAKGR